MSTNISQQAINQDKNTTAKFHAVLHVLPGKGCEDHLLQQSQIAQKSGATSVMLIPDYVKDKSAANKITDQKWNNIIKLLKKESSIKIGANPLGCNKIEILYRSGAELIQSDGGYMPCFDITVPDNLDLFFGIFFKYSGEEDSWQNPTTLQKTLSRLPIGAIATTSGPATGKSADPAKVSVIRQALAKESRLALASGVSTDNVLSYLNIGVTDFLVSTSLLKGTDENRRDLFDPDKVRKMSDMILAFNNL